MLVELELEVADALFLFFERLVDQLFLFFVILLDQLFLLFERRVIFQLFLLFELLSDPFLNRRCELQMLARSVAFREFVAFLLEPL